MSAAGWDIVQAVAATAELAKLAHETVKFLARVVRAQDEARQLLENTEILTGLVQDIGAALTYREKLRGSRVLAESEHQIIGRLEAYICRCKRCFKAIQKSIEPAAEKGRVYDRVKFVLEKNQIAKRESEVQAQINVLSAMLQTLSLISDAEHHDTERRYREQQERRQQELETTVFLLLAHMVKLTQRTNSSTTDREYARPATRSHSDRSHTVSRPLPMIENRQAQTVQDLLDQSPGRTDSSDHPQAFRVPVSHLYDVSEENAVFNDHSERALSYTSSNEDANSLPGRFPRVNIGRFALEATLITAVEENNVDLVRTFIERGDNPAAVRDDSDWTLLHLAVHYYFEEMVGLLLEQDACRTREYLGAQNNVGDTALTIAVRRESKRASLRNIERLLNQAECQVDAPARDGRTALYHAVNVGKPTVDTRREIVRLLADRGADVQTVYDKIPGQVKPYSFLSQYYTVITTAKASESTSSSSRRKSSSAATAAANIKPRKDSIIKTKRLSFSLKSRKNSSGGGDGAPGPSSPAE